MQGHLPASCLQIGLEWAQSGRGRLFRVSLQCRLEHLSCYQADMNAVFRRTSGTICQLKSLAVDPSSTGSANCVSGPLAAPCRLTTGCLGLKDLMVPSGDTLSCCRVCDDRCECQALRPLCRPCHQQQGSGSARGLNQMGKQLLCCQHLGRTGRCGELHLRVFLAVLVGARFLWPHEGAEL